MHRILFKFDLYLSLVLLGSLWESGQKISFWEETSRGGGWPGQYPQRTQTRYLWFQVWDVWSSWRDGQKDPTGGG